MIANSVGFSMKGEPRNDKQAADVYADLCRRRTFGEESVERASVIEALNAMCIGEGKRFWSD